MPLTPGAARDAVAGAGPAPAGALAVGPGRAGVVADRDTSLNLSAHTLHELLVACFGFGIRRYGVFV